METRKNILLNNITLNAFGWLAFILLIFLIIYYFTGIPFAFSFVLFIILPVIPPVYIHFYLFDSFFLKKKFILYTILLVMLIVLSGFFAQYIADITVNTEDIYYGGYLNPLIFILITTGIRSFRVSLQNKISLNEAFAEKAKAELKLKDAEAKQVNTELEFLKSQVNPHFLFNNLNNIYSLALEKSESTPDAVLQLSELMRYVMETGKGKYVNVDKELRFIENYVTLEHLRLKNKCRINYNVQGETNNKSIAPMLLIPFVENAFKHGIGINPEDNFVEIVVQIAGNTLKLEIKNSINKTGNSYVLGMGIDNVKKRLMLLYPNRYSLNIYEEDDVFYTSLNVEL